MSEIAIIAGSGKLPQKISEELSKQAKEHIIIALKNEAEIKAKYQFAITKIGAILNALEKENIKKIVFAGGVQRPNLLNIIPDSEGLQLLKQIMNRKNRGDDNLLSEVILFLENRGFEIISAAEIMPKMLAEEGIICGKSPNEMQMQDIMHGYNLIKHLSEYDIGQAVIVDNLRIMAIEASEGTKEMLARCKGGILIKAAKNGQNEKIDLPSIGENTIIQCQKAGIEMIAVEAGKTQIIDIEEVIKKANSAGISIYAIFNKHLRADI